MILRRAVHVRRYTLLYNSAILREICIRWNPRVFPVSEATLKKRGDLLANVASFGFVFFALTAGREFLVIVYEMPRKCASLAKIGYLRIPALSRARCSTAISRAHAQGLSSSHVRMLVFQASTE